MSSPVKLFETTRFIELTEKKLDNKSVFEGLKVNHNFQPKLSPSFDGSLGEGIEMDGFQKDSFPLEVDSDSKKTFKSESISDKQVNFEVDAAIGALGFDLGSLSAQVVDLELGSPKMDNADEISLPATHFHSCACAACFSTQPIDSGASFNTGSSKWSQPNGRGTDVTITYAFDNQFKLNGLNDTAFISLVRCSNSSE